MRWNLVLAIDAERLRAGAAIWNFYKRDDSMLLQERRKDTQRQDVCAVNGNILDAHMLACNLLVQDISGPITGEGFPS